MIPRRPTQGLPAHTAGDTWPHGQGLHGMWDPTHLLWLLPKLLTKPLTYTEVDCVFGQHLEPDTMWLDAREKNKPNLDSDASLTCEPWETRQTGYKMQEAGEFTYILIPNPPTHSTGIQRESFSKQIQWEAHRDARTNSPDRRMAGENPMRETLLTVSTSTENGNQIPLPGPWPGL